MDGVLMVGYKKGSVEHKMDLPHFREVKLIHDMRQDLDNYEGSFLFWCKLQVGNGIFQVSCFQPDFVALGEGGESLVVLQGHDLTGEFMCSKCFVSCSDRI